MKKLLTIFSLMFIILLVPTAYSANNIYVTRPMFQEQHRNQIIRVCEDTYGKDNIGDLYFCIMSEFYALEHVMDIMQGLVKDSEERKVFLELSRKYYIKEYKTYDFMSIEIEFRAYLQEKEIKNNEGNNLPDRSNLGR